MYASKTSSDCRVPRRRPSTEADPYPSLSFCLSLSLRHRGEGGGGGGRGRLLYMLASVWRRWCCCCALFLRARDDDDDTWQPSTFDSPPRKKSRCTVVLPDQHIVVPATSVTQDCFGCYIHAMCVCVCVCFPCASVKSGQHTLSTPIRPRAIFFSLLPFLPHPRPSFSINCPLSASDDCRSPSSV